MMRLNINKWIARRGSIVEVSWDASSMTSVQLVMKSAGRESVIDVDSAGSKRFRISGERSKKVISIRGVDLKGITRHVDRSIYMYGKPVDTNIYDSYQRISPLREKLTEYGQTVKSIWMRYPIEKRRLYLILVFLMTNLIFVSSHPELANTFTIIAIGYILYLIVKR